ncbi:protein phosphatase 2C domain-containing protein [Miniphocaeibacter massiliensis]|uniref:protein phosphatase 2C domain-containing protein n=1 Tax=Miniphocaeibacter massiliensis TaxID=2041841 RepID=UPI000C06A5C4|nr:protein phosphatase 2C domain-containing protein [Miniphocaeibacter massiliensis]
MFKSFKIANYTEKEYSEDSYFVSENYIIVIDGASSLIRYENSNFLTNKFVNGIRDNLAVLLSDSSINIQEALKKSLNNLLKKDKQKLFTKHDISATISIFRIVGEYLEIYYLGDSPIIIKTSSDIQEYVAKDISKLDSSVLKKMKEISLNKKTNVLESKNSKLIKDMLIKNRGLKNTKDGYWILDTTGKGIENGNYFRVTLKEIENIIVCSDGFSQIYDTFKIYNKLEDLFKDLENNSMENIVEKLVKEQNKDKDLNNYPRFTKTDDITAVYVGEIKC